MDPSNRGLGTAAQASGRLLNNLNDAQMDAAFNLIEKSMRALESGDEPKASRFIERACAIPYSEREQMHHGPFAAHMLLHGELVDAVTDATDEDDTWLAVALEVLGTSLGIGRVHLGDILHALAVEAEHYGLTPRESHRILRAVGERPLESDFALAPEASVEEQAAVARSLVDVALTYHRALYH